MQRMASKGCQHGPVCSMSALRWLFTDEHTASIIMCCICCGWLHAVLQMCVCLYLCMHAHMTCYATFMPLQVLGCYHLAAACFAAVVLDEQLAGCARIGLLQDGRAAWDSCG